MLLDDPIDSDLSREPSPLEINPTSLRKSTPKAKPPQVDPSAKSEREAENERRKRIKKVVASSEEGELYSRVLYCSFR